MTRVALYARYSSDNQREASIEDQLRIVDDELWRAVKARQGVIAEKYVNVTKAIRNHHKANRLNRTRRPRSLLSGLIFCGCCGGTYSLRGTNRFVCSDHVNKGTCRNSRTISREELESRVLAGLKDRMMAPEIAAEAVRAYAEETNRLNRERRSSGDAWKAELSDQLAEAPTDTSDLLPTASTIYAQKVANLTEALNRPEERQEVADALRMLIEKIVLIPGPERGEVEVTLYGELSTILNWTARQAAGKGTKTNTPEGLSSGVSGSLVARARNHRYLHSHQTLV